MIIKLILLILVYNKYTLANRIKSNEEGKRIYVSNCIRCHNSDPSKKGSLGPDLVTTPLEVFRTKVPKGTYPVGYTPKRSTKIMQKFPNLTTKVDLIYNYIQIFKGIK